MITVFGSLNLDLIGTVSRIPRPGETVPGGSFSTAAGGKGANQTLAARRAGARIRIAGAVGTDAFAGEAIGLLESEGVDLSLLRRETGPTGIAMIFVDAAGENVIAVLPGANGTATPAHADAALADLAPGDVLVTQQEIPQEATRRALEIAREKGIVSILNTAPFLSTTPELAPLAAILVANETEFALLAGEGDLETLMADWARRHGQTVIVTLGPDGARAATPEGLISVPALKVDPVDTVGAGDTFVGYLAAGLDAGMPLEAAMARAAKAASLACLAPGAQPAIPHADAVDAAR
ncbi:ribokinase [Devosia enhydra]|uniref:Ribokinase n=1 Tax=Devosia enhydra TaxID=665118 RepID=A0A1K2HX96_9HYPH|nr:ribokinase [Devosia enhydra]SFZ84250.1 ribokinase [Devosia enhydra]